MKHLSSRWAAATLLLPVIVILALLASSGRAPEAAMNSGKGTVEVAFAGNITSMATDDQLPVATAFQRLFLNIVAVRLNPSKDSQVSDFDSHWATILVPSGVGQNNPGTQVTTPFAGFGYFGPSGNLVSIGQGRSELQLDMNALQNGAAIFNSAAIAAKTYRQIELILDPTTQGVAVPLCASSAPSGEGCVAYPAIFTPSGTGILDRTIRMSSTIDVTRGSFQTLLIYINLAVGTPPVSTNGKGNPSQNSVAIVPSISSTPPPNLVLPAPGTLSGTVTNAGKHLKVVAELSGTNQIVASTGVATKTNSSLGTVKGGYSMSLPGAVIAPNTACTASNGTLYDIYTTGSGEYQIRSGVPVCANLPTTGIDFTVVHSTLGQITGTIFDDCNSGVTVPSATLVLYEPDTSAGVTGCAFDSLGNVIAIPKPSGNAPPGLGCVAVATAQSDPTGVFPMPGNSFTSPPFAQIPFKVPDQPKTTTPIKYSLKVTASGYNGLVVPVTADGTSLKCKDLGNKNDSCNNLSLEHGQLTTTVNLASASASGANVMVMAEDQSSVGGVNTGLIKVEGLGMANIPAGGTSASVTMNVPDDGTGSSKTACDGATPDNFCILGTETATGAPLSLDVFGQQQDLYFGAPQNATNHSIGAQAAVGGSSRCPSSPINATIADFSCTGHGSIGGFVGSADAYTTVVLSQGGVNLMQSGVAPLFPAAGTEPGNAYSFCAPGAATYTLQHFESVPNGAPAPASDPVSVAVPAPLATATTGCAQICSQSNGQQQCQFCVNATAPTLP